MSDRDRPKRSWREIDARRDGSRGSSSSSSSGGGSPRDNGPDAKSSRAHRAALDALFEKGELGKYAEKLGLGTPKTEPKATPTTTAAAPAPEPPKVNVKEQERLALRKKLLDGTSRDAVGRAFDKYVKTYGMPKDWELLERGLEHPRDDRLVEVISEIEGLLDRDKPRRTRTLDSRLRFIEETHDDKDLRARAAALRGRLG